MNTLMIKDLSITEQLDSKAMRAVRGGYGFGAPSTSYFNFSPVVAPNNSKNVDATQLISNELNIQNANGNNVAFASWPQLDDQSLRHVEQQHPRVKPDDGEAPGSPGRLRLRADHARLPRTFGESPCHPS